MASASSKGGGDCDCDCDCAEDRWVIRLRNASSPLCLLSALLGERMARTAGRPGEGGGEAAGELGCDTAVRTVGAPRALEMMAANAAACE